MKYLNKVCRGYEDLASPPLNLALVLSFGVESLQHVSSMGSI